MVLDKTFYQVVNLLRNLTPQQKVLGKLALSTFASCSKPFKTAASAAVADFMVHVHVQLCQCQA